MAGIGFELQRMIDQGQGLVGRVRGYACAGLISSGPWIMTIATLGVLSIFGPLVTPQREYELFRGLITYAFAFSLITVGLLQMSATRRVADLLYAGHHDRVLPSFNASLIVTGAVQAVVGTVFCWVAELPIGLSFAAVSLYVVVSLSWLAMIWLGVTREYDDILKAYGFGALAGLAALPLLGKWTDAAGLLTVYTAGQAVTLVLLVRTIVRGMEAGGRRSYEILGSLRTFPRLVVIGVAYNAAIWIDKIVFWLLNGTGPHPLVQFHPLYDTCTFLAYMTVIPALAVNLVRVETSFYECYRRYYGAILGGRPLSLIDRERNAMFRNMEGGMVRLLRVQGAITVLFMIFAPYIVDAVGLPETAVRVFRATCLGAFFHVMLLVTVLMQLYFDLRRAALLTTLVFLVVNGALAVWSVEAGVATYGLGYAAAALVSLLLGYALLAGNLRRLDYLTFTQQPIESEPADTHTPPRPAEVEAAPKRPLAPLEA